MNLARRDAAVIAFRRKVQAQFTNDDGVQGLIPLRHQAEWQLASEGWTLLDAPPVVGEQYAEILVTIASLPPGARILARRTINQIPCAIVRRRVTPREGGAAHILADLAAYKAGKSFWTAVWAAGFGIIPGAKIHLVGLEYSTSEPEFNYLADFLLGERGMNIKANVFHNDPRNGRMKIALPMGATFEVKSWERKEGLKGKTITAYVFCEAYQLPGLEVYNRLSQNLRQLRGYVLFPTTPDNAWVGVFHDFGHGHDPDWHCSCHIDARENPYTYDQRARDRDDPMKEGIMTQERYRISWEGKLGAFVGRVYDVARGDVSRQFSPLTHPQLWSPKTLRAVDVHPE